MIAILPVMLILACLFAVAKVGVVTMDAASDVWNFELHPAKLAARIGVVVMGLSFMSVLLYIAFLLCRTTPLL